MSHIETRQRRREHGLADDVPRCSKCDGLNDRAPQRYCAGCHARYQQAWRARHRIVPRETRFTRGIDA